VRGSALAAGVVAVGTALSLAAAPSRAADEPPPRPPPPDVRFYALRVARFLETRCAKCHVDGGGAFRLAAPTAGENDERRRRRDFEALAPFLDRDAPWRSRLLRKILAPAEGGLPHEGGAFLTTDDEEHDDLLDFASGATFDNLPPVAAPGRDRRVRVGVEEILDAGDSYDRDDDPLAFRWDLAAAPPGSRAALEDARTAKARLRPDVAGVYVVHLRVTDGKAWSAAHPVALEALDVVGVDADPLRPSGLDALPPETLRALRRLHLQVLGRSPTPAEAIARAKVPIGDVAATLLSSLEWGRTFAEDAALRLELLGDAEPSSEAAAELALGVAVGRLSPAAAEAALVRDPAFLRAHPPGRALVDAVFARLLEREPAPGEAKAAAFAAAGAAASVFGVERVASAPALLEAVLATEEFETAALRRLAARFLPPDAARAVDAARRGETASALALSFVRSPSWAGGPPRRKEDGDFLRSAFVDLVGRRPSAAELSALVSAARAVPGEAARNALVKVMIDGGEARFPLLVEVKDPGGWVADRFLRTLGRKPAAAEAEAYVAALLDPEGGPDLVVRALLTSSENQVR
jgi:hypothetical protein